MICKGVNTIKSFFRLRPFLSEHKRYYIIGIGALILTNIAQLVIPKLLGYLTDLVGSGELTWNALMRVMIAFIILSILIAFFRYFWRINIMGTARRMEYTHCAICSLSISKPCRQNSSTIRRQGI